MKLNIFFQRVLGPEGNQKTPHLDRALIYYRYVSWFLTSAFYLTGPPASPPVFKLGVVVALLLAGHVTLHLHINDKEAPWYKPVILIMIETMGIALLLLPTGGLDSPFIWYALNPIFMATALLQGLYCWGVLLVFLVSATTGSVLYKGYQTPLLPLWQEHSWLLLAFLLLTTAAQVFASFIRHLSHTYEKLAQAHRATETSLEHIATLYQALEAFTGEDPRRLAKLLAQYARKLTASQVGFCYLSQGDGPLQREISDPHGVLKDTNWKEQIEAIWWEQQESPWEPNNATYGNLVCLPVQSPGARFGLLGYITPSEFIAGNNGSSALAYLAELGAIVLERCRTEELVTHLLVSEEQNRIANEIHDGVSQHLFSIVYALHSISQKRANLQDITVQKQLQLIKSTANTAARELRASIYRISPLRRGEKVFVAGISTYLNGLAQLNNIKVDLEVEGSEETLSPALRKALYRIVREAASNALRHGKSSQIKVTLHMAPGKMLLRIADNGQGFDLSKQNHYGLGLTNMRNLMLSFQGKFKLESNPGQGTVVTCGVPGDRCRPLNMNQGGTGYESNCS